MQRHDKATASIGNVFFFFLTNKNLLYFSDAYYESDLSTVICRVVRIGRTFVSGIVYTGSGLWWIIMFVSVPVGGRPGWFSHAHEARSQSREQPDYVARKKNSICRKLRTTSKSCLIISLVFSAIFPSWWRKLLSSVYSRRQKQQKVESSKESVGFHEYTICIITQITGLFASHSPSFFLATCTSKESISLISPKYIYWYENS